METNDPTYTYHRFLDEAGDTTFYGKKKSIIIGNNGVSKSFSLGMVKFKQPLGVIRDDINKLVQQVISDPYYSDIPSIRKKVNSKGFYFHATDDIPEVRKLFYEYISGLDCSFEAVIGRKRVDIYESKHNSKEAEFYADLLSHLLKNKLQLGGKLVLNIASRGNTTKNHNLELALRLAIEKHHKKRKGKPIQTKVVFNVQSQEQEPILNVTDYFCWAIQRLIERGEIRYYNYLKDKIKFVTDIYDWKKYKGSMNCYTPKKPMTIENLIVLEQE